MGLLKHLQFLCPQWCRICNLTFSNMVLTRYRILTRNRIRIESLIFPETLLKTGVNWCKESFLDRKIQAKKYFEVKNYCTTSKHCIVFPQWKNILSKLGKTLYGWVGSIHSAGTLAKRKSHVSFSINFNAIEAVLGDGGDSPG